MGKLKPVYSVVVLSKTVKNGCCGEFGIKSSIVRPNAGSVGGVREKVSFQADEEGDSQLNPSRDLRSRSHFWGTPDCIPSTEPTTTPR